MITILASLADVAALGLGAGFMCGVVITIRAGVMLVMGE